MITCIRMCACSWDCCGGTPPWVSEFINYQNRDDFYYYKKLQGENKFKYNRYNHTHGRWSASADYRNVNNYKKTRDRNRHHARRNKIRDLISRNNLNGKEDISKVHKHNNKWGL